MQRAKIFALCLCPALVWISLLPGASAAESRHTIVLSCETNQVGKYEKIEFTLELSNTYTNPFDPDEVEVAVRLVTPDAQMIKVPAFWCQPYERRRLQAGQGMRDWMYPLGSPCWKARFAPSEIGTYQAVGLLRDAGGSSVSRRLGFDCVRSERKGFVRVSTRDPRFFEFTEGQPFFPIGQNLAFIGSQQYVTLSKAEEIFGQLAEHGANYLRIWTCCEDWAMALEARKSAFGRSWDWYPPIVPIPDAESQGLKCVKLTGDKNGLRVEPSHPVALRPATSYVLAGKVRFPQAAGAAPALKIELGGKEGAAVMSGSGGPWQGFQYEFQSSAEEFWLPPLSLKLEGQQTAWISDFSLRETGGSAELLWEADVNRPLRGYYNQLDCLMLDELLSAAERKNIFLQLCLLTRDLYMKALKDPASPEYDLAIQDARKVLRYAIARWGYSTSVAAWEYWNEMDPGLPTDKFYAALGEYLKFSDPYRHLRTTSAWGPSVKDCRLSQLDIADVHFYLRPSDKGQLEDEVDAVLERTHWLREQAPDKPVHLGEFGLANEKWQTTEEMKQSSETADLHNALWASALSGASGTAMFWWWERLDQRKFYAQYGPLSQFLAQVPWNSGELQLLSGTCSNPRLRTVGLRTRARAWLWVFNRAASWAKIVLEKDAPQTVSKAEIELPDWPSGTYQVSWWDTRQGIFVRQESCASNAGALRVVAPDFSRDIACLISERIN